MALQLDEQAPGVSATLRRRIASALDAGERPTLQGNNLKLGSIVLQSANGTDRPALREAEIQMRRRNIDARGAFDIFNSAPVRRGRGRYATDITGNERMITRTVNGEQRVTATGKRYYKQSYTRWLVHIPTILVRRSTGGTFQRTRHDRTGEELGLSRELQARGSEAEQRRQVQQAVEAYLLEAGGEDAALDLYNGDEGIEVRYDPRREITYSMQTQGIRDGQMTADTILDRVVFGEPIMAEDMWQLGQLHEVSRRRSGECGLDVIVASATQWTGKERNTRKPMLTAEQAAETLVRLARETEPESDLAQASFKEVPQTAEIVGIDSDLRTRSPDVSSLLPFKPGLMAFLSKPRSLDEVKKAIDKNHIWRKPYTVSATYAKAVKACFPWSPDPRNRLLLFLRSLGWHIRGEEVTDKEPVPDAVEIVRQCGTPVRLLERYFRRLGVRLILFNGSRCNSIWEPGDWASRDWRDKTTVILNVWSDHVSTYNPEAARALLNEKGERKWHDVKLKTTRADDEEHKYDEMLEFEWPLLIEALQKPKGAGINRMLADWICETLRIQDEGKDKEYQQAHLAIKDCKTYLRSADDVKKLKSCAILQEMLADAPWDSLKPYESQTAFWTTMDEETLRKGLLAHRMAYVPHYASPGHMNSVDVPFNDGKHVKTIRIKRVPDNHAELRQFCQNVQDRLGLKLFYKGESAGLLGHNFLREFLIRKRAGLSKAQKAELLVKQDNRCAKCRDLLGGTSNCEAHHDPPVAEGGGPEDIVLLCPTCHAEETEKQELKALGTPQYFESQLSPDMMEAFKTTPKPRQLHYGDPKMKDACMAADDSQPLGCLDVCGCRSNALLSREWLPVGTPLDAFRPVFAENGDYDLGDISEYAWLWVDVPEGEHDLYDGAHLYPWETVQVLIEDGFLIAGKETIPFGWRPWREFPSKDLADAWQALRDCGGDKKMILSAIGIWNKQERYTYCARTTDREEDLPGPVTIKHYKADCTIMMCQSRLHDNRTMLPVSLLCLFDEQRRMYRARQLVAKVPKIVPLGCRVDGLYYVGPEEAVAELRSICAEEQYDCIQRPVYQFKDCKWKDVPICSQRDGRGRDCFKPPIRREWACFQEGDALKQVITNMLGDETQQIIEDVTKTCDGKLDESQAHVVLAAMTNGGAEIIGAAGVGKSQIIKALRTSLEQEGQKVIVCAYTHAACRLVGGKTIAHLLHLSATMEDAWIIVDEVGLIPTSTLGDMSRWMAVGAKFVVFGDYQGQFKPFVDKWKLDVCPEWSPLMHQMCNGLHIKVTEYRRGTDLELFNWYCSLYDKEHPLVEESRRRYPAVCDPDDDPLVLCISHSRRMIINARQNARVKPADAVFLECSEDEAPGCTMKPQDMWIWPGIQLIGCPRGSGTNLVVQGVIYKVLDITEEIVKLQMCEEYCHGADDETVEIPRDSVVSQLRLTHAMCYYTCQGRTVKDRHIVLLDTDHPHFSTRSLIVGLSRATHGRYLHIGDNDIQQTFCGDRLVRKA